ncbi:aminopeptidase P family N-terminal domain-containing protein, partial [Gemmatimonas sp.]|uniref:aminopeptidase P family N-terminal domain-containing protein n=1 Tax=Gemmatimonas sp. TaxID=1962908 RepID=UPI0037C06212
MTTRRDFLATSSASLAALAVTGCAKAEADASGAASTQSDLPPAIAALTPMKDGVVPISVDERKARLEKARRLMTEQKIDALMLAGGTSMEYFTGMRWGNSERLLAVVIPAKGAPFLV